MMLVPFPNADISKPVRPQNKAIAPSFTNRAAVPASEPPQPASRAAFDAEATLARVGGNPELLRRMVGLFAMQWHNLLAATAKAGRHRDGPILELTANKLKQSLGSFGAREASRVAQELEGRGRNSDFDDVEKTCTRLKTEVERLVNSLKEFAEELNPATQSAAPAHPRPECPAQP